MKFKKKIFQFLTSKLTLKVRFWHFLTNCNSFSWEIVNFFMVIKGISIFWSLIFPNPILIVLKFLKVKDLVIIRWYCVYSSFFLFPEPLNLRGYLETSTPLYQRHCCVKMTLKFRLFQFHLVKDIRLLGLLSCINKSCAQE